MRKFPSSSSAAFHRTVTLRAALALFPLRERQKEVVVCIPILAIIGYVSNESCDYRCKDSIIALRETFISFSHSVEMIEPSLRDEFAY